MRTVAVKQPSDLPLIRFCGYFSVIAGLLGILGWHLHQQDKVGILGLTGFFLAFMGTGFIAGPSAKIFGYSAYSLGIPVVAIGMLVMSLCSLRRQAIPRWIVVVFRVSLAVMIVSFYAPWLYQPISFFNIVFGIGFLGLGCTLIKEYR